MGLGESEVEWGQEENGRGWGWGALAAATAQLAGQTAAQGATEQVLLIHRPELLESQTPGRVLANPASRREQTVGWL